MTYTPAANYAGPDSFTFTVNDGTATSSPATVSIEVTPQTPAATVDESAKQGCSSGTGGEAAPLGALLVVFLVRGRRRRGA